MVSRYSFHFKPNAPVVGFVVLKLAHGQKQELLGKELAG